MFYLTVNLKAKKKKRAAGYSILDIFDFDYLLI